MHISLRIYMLVRPNFQSVTLRTRISTTCFLSLVCVSLWVHTRDSLMCLFFLSTALCSSSIILNSILTKRVSRTRTCVSWCSKKHQHTWIISIILTRIDLISIWDNCQWIQKDIHAHRHAYTSHYYSSLWHDCERAPLLYKKTMIFLALSTHEVKDILMQGGSIDYSLKILRGNFHIIYISK